jgi:HEAT repeat protein
MTMRSCVLLAASLAAPVFAQPQPRPAPMPVVVRSSGQLTDDESVKAVALNSLMEADPERGVPIAEGILKGTGSYALKERALSALTQSRSARAQQVVSDYARSAADPNLQVRAIRYIGRSQSKDNQQQIAALYPAATNAQVREEIIRSLSNSGSTDALMTIIRSEKDQELRNRAIRSLANSESTPAATITALYASETDPNARRAVISALLGRGEVKSVIELARKESDPAMKGYIVQRLGGMSKNRDAMDFMTELLK